MTKRNVMIRILTSRLELGASLFDDTVTEEDEEYEEEEPKFDLAAMLGEMPEPEEMKMNPPALCPLPNGHSGKEMSFVMSRGFDHVLPLSEDSCT